MSVSFINFARGTISLPGRLELRSDAPPRGAPPEELRELPGEHAPELVAPEEEFHI